MVGFEITCNKCGFDECQIVTMCRDEYDFDTEEHYEVLDGVGILCPVCKNYTLID